MIEAPESSYPDMPSEPVAWRYRYVDHDPKWTLMKNKPSWSDDPDCECQPLFVGAAQGAVSRDEIAKTMWLAEYRRATGKERNITWYDVLEDDRNKYLFVADAIIATGFAPESYRETVRRVGAAREKRLLELRRALEKIANYSPASTIQPVAIARETLAVSSTDREGK